MSSKCDIITAKDSYIANSAGGTRNMAYRSSGNEKYDAILDHPQEKNNAVDQQVEMRDGMFECVHDTGFEDYDSSSQKSPSLEVSRDFSPQETFAPGAFGRGIGQRSVPDHRSWLAQGTHPYEDLANHYRPHVAELHSTSAKSCYIVDYCERFRPADWKSLTGKMRLTAKVAIFFNNPIEVIVLTEVSLLH
jgi:hypothetical protein